MIMIRLIFALLIIISQSSFADDFNNLKTIGKTPLNFFGFKLYDIELMAKEPEFSYNQRLAIKIIYNRSFSKEELINSSIDEICRINSLKKQDIEIFYREQFDKIFVDVKKGDEKIAIYDPKSGLELYYNKQLTGKINNVIFAKRFIDIWLSDKARFKEVRNILIANK